jgi:hypothetical protein
MDRDVPQLLACTAAQLVRAARGDTQTSVAMRNTDALLEAALLAFRVEQIAEARPLSYDAEAAALQQRLARVLRAERERAR